MSKYERLRIMKKDVNTWGTNRLGQKAESWRQRGVGTLYFPRKQQENNPKNGQSAANWKNRR